MRRLDFGRAKATEIAISYIVGHDVDNIPRRTFLMSRGREHHADNEEDMGKITEHQHENGVRLCVEESGAGSYF